MPLIENHCVPPVAPAGPFALIFCDATHSRQEIDRNVPALLERLSPGGMIVVDDCWTKSRHLWVEGVANAYDGAMQAYKEFVAARGLPEEFAETKLALIRR
mgnify:CR=1 FL=1